MPMLTNDQHAKVVFSSPRVTALLNEMGERLRGVYQYAHDHAPTTDLSDVRALLLRFDDWKDSEGEFAVVRVAGEATGVHLETDESVWKRVTDVVVGDVLDLEGDPIADKDPESSNRISYESEYSIVDHVEREAPDVIAIGIEGIDVFGFPIDHLVKFVKHNAEYDDNAED